MDKASAPDDVEKNSTSIKRTDDGSYDGDDVEREGSLRRHLSVVSAAGAVAVASVPSEAHHDKQNGVSDDPNAVGWDGPDDPANPQNWPQRQKWLNIGALSIMTVLT